MNKKIILIYIAFLVVIFLGLLAYWVLSQNKPVQAENIPKKVIETKPAIELGPQEPQYQKVEHYTVPILMYHYIRNAEGEDNLGKKLSVSPENFEAQLEWLKENGYETLKMADLSDPKKKVLSEIYATNKKPVVLTFDDGYLDAYTDAYPILKKYDFTGTFYIIKNFVGKDRYMNQTQINKMEQNGMEIGSHTLSHPNLAISSPGKVRKELAESITESKVLCYPSGRYNQEVIDLVKEAGYANAVTTKYGIVNESSNPYELPRVRIENILLENFAKKLQ